MAVELKGSHREADKRVHSFAPASPQERIEVTIRLRGQSEPKPGNLTREQFVSNHGASLQDLMAVDIWAHGVGLTMVEMDAAKRHVIVSGSVADLEKAFGTTISHYAADGYCYRGRTGPLTIPDHLDGIITGVFGLDNRPAAKPHFRHHRGSVPAGFTPETVANLYGKPSGATGAGQTIAIIELGGGYKQADLISYFKQLGLPLPSVTQVLVDHAQNKPDGANGADGEVMLDIEVVGCVAPAAKIVVYFAPNTDQGFLDAITTAVHDTHNNPHIVSISWGGPEDSWTAQAIQAMNEAIQAAAAIGVTVCVASGDSGSTDGETGNHVDFPASSPWSLSCGGTRLVGSGTTITAETVWNDGAQGGASGGGLSTVFATPSYQTNLTANRGVPDVSGDADPETGYLIPLDGQEMIIGGTSAVAPLWAGFVAILNEKLGKSLGFINPSLYAAPPGTMRDITEGNNGAYQAGPGWDACTGLGSPNGAQLLAVLGK